MRQLKVRTQVPYLARIHALAAILLGILFLSNCGQTAVKTAVSTPAAVTPNTATVTTQTTQAFIANFVGPNLVGEWPSGRKHDRRDH